MRILISGIFLIIIAVSCYYDSEEFLYPQINNTCDTTNVTYNLSIKPIMNSCLICHSNGAAASSGGSIKLEDYADVKSKVDDGHLWGALAQSSGYSPMPKDIGKLNDCDLSKIKVWIGHGAPNN
jgi:hypothetical protein